MSESDEAVADRPPKRVRIADNPGKVVGLVESLSDQERVKSWYSSTEFAASKDSVKEICRTYRQSRRYSDCLTQAYNTACGLADQHESIQKEQENPVSKDTELPDEGLSQWIQGHSRGLEGYSSRLHAMRRHRHFQDTKHAVFLEQARQNINKFKDDTMLAKQAEQASRRARSFAFLLGKADAWAAQKDDSPTPFESEDGDVGDKSSVCPAGQSSVEEDGDEKKKQHTQKPGEE
mmetsp:Transcript_7977/g.15933  ORF Transcript_7977/g.15933 Transcript_7977/m.15933 type:complete len:234 (-) Transcript_7977:354-1055(-)|eukprot:scaffold83_cov181-Amphora_coffeaeformis.AAC.23